MSSYTRYQESLEGLPDLEKVELVNLFWTYSIDYLREAEGKDHWQTPKETLSLGTGDCEDKATGIFVDLVDAGLKARLIYGLVALYDGGSEGHIAVSVEIEGKKHAINDVHGFAEIMSMDWDNLYNASGVVCNLSIDTVLPRWAECKRRIENGE